jgi:hypothetical protein
MGFFRTISGKCVALSVAVSFIFGGLSALVGPGLPSTFLLCIALFSPIVINMVGLPLALEKDWGHAVIAVAALPLLFFLWAVGVGAIREHHTSLALPFLIAGLAVLAFALRPAAAHGHPEQH